MMRIALVGAGTMGSYHARVIAASDRVTLARVVDAHRPTGEAAAERYGAHWAPALDDLVGVDAVVVAASTEAHHGIALQVLTAGVPLLVEKPVVDDFAQAREVIELAERGDIPIVCGFLERYNPAVIAARQLVGEPVHITATRHSPYAPRIKTGVAWDLLIHDVDLAIGLLGASPTTVSGARGRFHPASAPGAEDVASATLGFGAGQVAHLSASRIGQRKERMLTVHELDRMVEVDLLRRDVTVYRHLASASSDDEGRGYRQQTAIEIPEITNAREPLAAQFDHFLDIVDGRADAAAERATILPPHAVIDGLTT